MESCGVGVNCFDDVESILVCCDVNYCTLVDIIRILFFEIKRLKVELDNLRIT